MNSERQHEALLKVYRVLTVCASEAPYAVDEQGLFQAACNMLVRFGLFRLAWFGYAGENVQRIAQPIAWAGGEQGFLEDLKLALNQNDYEDPASVCLRTGDVCWIKDLAANQDLGPIRPALVRCGYTSVLSVPVMSNGDSYGALTLYYNDPEEYGQDVVSVLKEKILQMQRVFGGRSANPRPRSEEIEADLRGLVDALPITVGLLNTNGMLIHLNRRLVDTTGYNLEDHIFRNAVLKYVHPDDVARMFEVSAQGYAQGAAFEIELRHLRKDNRYHWVLVNVAPIRDEEGRIVRWCTTGTDIQQLKQTEEKLRQSEADLRQILDLAPQHVYVLGADPGGTRLYANQAALDYFGLSFEEWRAHDLRKLFHPDDWERASGGTQSQVADGLPHEVEIRLRGKDGKYRWFLSRRNPLRDELGRLTRWYTAATDIEDRKAAERRLAGRKCNAARRDRQGIDV